MAGGGSEADPIALEAELCRPAAESMAAPAAQPDRAAANADVAADAPAAAAAAAAAILPVAELDAAAPAQVCGHMGLLDQVRAARRLAFVLTAPPSYWI